MAKDNYFTAMSDIELRDFDKITDIFKSYGLEVVRFAPYQAPNLHVHVEIKGTKDAIEKICDDNIVSYAAKTSDYCITTANE